MKWFHGEDKERVEMAVDAALAEFKERMKGAIPDLAKLAVDESLRKADILLAKDLEPLLLDSDKRRLVMFSAFVKRGAPAGEAMKQVMAEGWLDGERDE